MWGNFWFCAPSSRLSSHHGRATVEVDGLLTMRLCLVCSLFLSCSPVLVIILLYCSNLFSFLFNLCFLSLYCPFRFAHLFSSLKIPYVFVFMFSSFLSFYIFPWFIFFIHFSDFILVFVYFSHLFILPVLDPLPSSPHFLVNLSLQLVLVFILLVIIYGLAIFLTRLQNSKGH